RGLDSPDEAVFYTSGRTSNEAAFLYQLFVRQFGTNNLPDCSNMCHESSGTGLTEVIGVGKGTVSLEDFERADAIFIIGQNPGTNHPRMLATLQKAKRRGCRIVSINPLKEAALVKFAHPQEVKGMLGVGTPISDMYLQVRVGGDVAALKGIMKEVLALEDKKPGSVLDHEFIAQYTDGFDAFRAGLEAVDMKDLLGESGLTREQFRRAAKIYAGADRVIVCWAMGLTQHRFAISNIQEIVNLLMLRGNIGKPGAGACPVRGHSNVQGDRTMGIWERPEADFLDRLGEEFNFAPPREHGLDTLGAMRAMHDGKAKAFIAMGGNFAVATPDTPFAEEGLRRCRLTVQISTKLNRSHLVTGEEALILPCLGRTERDLQKGGAQFVTVEDSMRVVHRSQGRLSPASEDLRSEPAIVAGMARAALGKKNPVRWEWLVEDYDRTRDHIARVIPGFEEFNRRVREPGGFVLPNSAHERRFATPGGKALFTVHPLPRIELGNGEFVMMTIRSHDQFNTTIYGLDDRYRGISGGRRVVFLNAAEMKKQGLEAQQLVDLTSRFNGQTRTLRGFRAIPFDIPVRCAATYYPEGNPLVPLDQFAEKSRTPAYKSVVITVTPGG
ncbi:MAG: FdhF/YdeP family oxidoreductase, partial [Deltaproteobacteria bacterium]|nr:FdhF/YdeP family oxidoreductase [Deltaproteobacteria bacterium]